MAEFSNPSIEAINSINVEDVFNNVINVNEGMTVESIHIDEITIENTFNPTFLNNQPFDKLLFRNADANFDTLRINGNVTFINGVYVQGLLDGIAFNTENVLLNAEDQHFNRIEADSVICDKLSTTNINNVNLFAEHDIITNISILYAKNITLGGLLNKIHLPTLDKYALRTFGTQMVSGRYHFDGLELEELNSESISGVNIPEELIVIHGNAYTIPELNFENNFQVRELKVTNSLNAIRVDKGNLDVLLLNSPVEQRITGYKEIDNLTLLSPVSLQSGIQSKRLQEMNPVKIMDRDFIIEEDVTILGDVNFKGTFKAEDMLTADLGYAVRRLFEAGITINQTSIPIHLNFSQGIKVCPFFN